MSDLYKNINQNSGDGPFQDNFEVYNELKNKNYKRENKKFSFFSTSS
jgi:hypothetical protein